MGYLTNLLSVWSKAVNAIDVLLVKLWMFLVWIVYSVKPIFFAIEPFVGKLNEINASTEVLGDACKNPEAKFCNFQIITITTTWYRLQDFLKILLWSFQLLLVTRYHSIFDFNFKHHREVPAILVDVLIPVYHWFKFAFYSFNNAMGQKLIIIC